MQAVVLKMVRHLLLRDFEKWLRRRKQLGSEDQRELDRVEVQI